MKYRTLYSMVGYFRSTLPNLLTILRVLAIPAIVCSFYIQNDSSNYIAFIIFIFACITDFFDGYLARIWQTQSKFGRLFDPIADKLIVSATLIMLVYIGKVTKLTIIPVVIIICREILISGLREFLISMNFKIPVIKLGKVKTFIQMAAIAMLMLDYSIILYVADIILYIAAGLTVYSAYLYICVALRQIYSQE
ncbi:CDP-diacylglycerol--glycerol-3-phosphate 3-phosphatidyltransferase [Ehrlichia ruminantium]|uniref:CDP-diacylglycerol--glycerol-3-phosphate 3-phosphatidyltransferase n=2 Tax=Ehrlichia ruminantium TaxID=779 RepID=A0A0H3M9E5_EHRRW|nr:CDP-diacylglycerol--glycerol-3-phosphate 3-phosphatidyltransferase [Ehrlichia ruminantium]CAI27373.1 CDP-diacylglycerol--glycerol-3-phosphate 3-phosphatidyltransferase [Ehrlichia ruminantium str. Welgevonden]CAI28322.1 CDP-diacylglycerol--glycerol-3-phosphate 3-phosphatidyltransferase [Ehrlichia ruminantium str. Gardel]QLK54592.1 CDP-diacylglycerol--glycerol-3-phosphate 3-phosphatidyltransferase [Ehrlichia ruminantium]QLK55516.1 CDP-diacylglycerol--glycerol-3-phosphate 3-phosphatidyltransfer